MTEQEQQKLNKYLLHAAAKGDLDDLKELLDYGADIEAKTNGGWNALHLASSYGWLAIVKELLGRGANIEAKTDDRTALHLASVRYHLDIVKELLGRGALVGSLTLMIYPELTLDKVHEHMKMEDKWASALMFILKEQDKYSVEEFKANVLEFLFNTKIEVPDNIRIILNTLI